MLRVELATTPSMQARGLMYREKLAEDEGMAFIFDKSDKLAFWGVNTYIPLDIAFVDKNNRIVQISKIEPMNMDMVKSSKDCCIAIETNLGYFDVNRVKIGDQIQIDRDRSVIEFNRGSGDLITRLAQSVINWEDNIIDTDYASARLEDLFDDDDEGEDQEGLEEEQTPDVQEQPEQGLNETPEFDGELTEPPEFPVPDKEYPEFHDVKAALSWAENNNEVMHISYTTLRGRDLQRMVEPHGMFRARTTGNPILVTFDQTIGDIRAFITDQILAYSFTGQKFDKKFVVG